MKTKILFSLFAVFVFISSLSAQDDTDTSSSSNSAFRLVQQFRIDSAYYFAHHQGYKTTGFSPVNYNRMDWKYLNDHHTVDPNSGARNDFGTPFAVELKANYSCELIFPVMRKNNMFMKDNHIVFKAHANLSPVSFEVGPTLEIKPLAFFLFGVTQLLGTGWDLAPLNVNGLAINEPDFAYSDDRTRFKRSEGLVSFTKMFAAIQFDTGAIWKGNWTHVVLRVFEEFTYQHFTGAEKDEYWRWEHDAGENQNGFVWIQYITLGYMMPTLPGNLRLVGIRIENEKRLTGMNQSKMEDGGWGSDFLSTKFGPMFVFEFKDKLSESRLHNFIVLAEFQTQRQFTDETVVNRYFKEREVNKNDKTYVHFWRLAMVWNMKF